MATHKFLSEATKAELKATAKALLAPGRGILAADECVAAMADRFSSIGVENSEENRRKYRQILFSTSKVDLDPIAGVILQHETCYQVTDEGKSFLRLLEVI
jgi:fructose-bisphosphate aldolase class I